MKEVYGTSQWRQMQRLLRSERPQCERKCGRVATELHHKLRLADGGDPFALDNIEKLCHFCHAADHRPFNSQ